MNEIHLCLENSDAHAKGIESLNTIILQLIIASSALLTFTITFLEKLKEFGNYSASKLWLVWAWVFLVISIVLGSLNLFELSGFLLQYSKYQILRFKILEFTAAQFCLFCLAMFCILTFAVESTTGIINRTKIFLQQLRQLRRKKRKTELDKRRK